MNIIKHKNIFLSVSGLIVLVAVISTVFLGLKPGIDFTSGSLWEFNLPDSVVSKADLESFVTDELGLEQSRITQPGTGGYMIKTKELTEVEHQDFLEQLENKYGTVDELRFDSIGSAVSQELRDKAIWAFIINLIAISAYIAYAFRKVSYPVKSWNNGPKVGMSCFNTSSQAAGFQTSMQMTAPTIITSSFGPTSRNSRNPSGTSNRERLASLTLR